MRVYLNFPRHILDGLWPYSPDRQTFVTGGGFAAGDLLQSERKKLQTIKGRSPNVPQMVALVVVVFLAADVIVATSQTLNRPIPQFSELVTGHIFCVRVSCLIWFQFTVTPLSEVVLTVSTSCRLNETAAAVLTQISDQSEHLCSYVGYGNVIFHKTNNKEIKSNSVQYQCGCCC